MINRFYNEVQCANLKLIDNSAYAKNRQEFFRDVMDLLADQTIAALAFGDDMKHVSGYFVEESVKMDNRENIFMPRIRLPENCAELGDDWIKFNDDEKFAVFVHEASHFLHFIKDKGKYTAPSLVDKKPATYKQYVAFGSNNTIDLEYEAGYRSLVTNAIYELFPEGDRTILENNLDNMANYIEFDNKKELFKKYYDDTGYIIKATEEEAKKFINATYDKWKAGITKWTQIATYKDTLPTL